MHLPRLYAFALFLFQALVSELKKEEKEKEDPDEVEITWDLGLQEKSQKLLESYKGKCFQTVHTRVRSSWHRYAKSHSFPYADLSPPAAHLARKAEESLTLGEKYARERKLKKRAKKKAVRTGHVSAIERAACLPGVSPLSVFACLYVA